MRRRARQHAGAAIVPAADAGFTLIEALVALAIGGFVITTLASITGQWMRSWRTGAPVLQRAEMLVSGLDRIADDLASARFMPAGPDGTGLLFAGDETAVTFVRRTLPVELPAGLEIIRLAAPTGGGDVTLARSRAPLPFGSFPTAPADPAPMALLRPPYSIRFAYAGQDGAWQSGWHDAKSLPDMIRVQIVDRKSGRSLLAPLVVRVHAEAPVLCATAVASARFCDIALGRPVTQAPVVGALPQSASGP